MFRTRCVKIVVFMTEKRLLKNGLRSSNHKAPFTNIIQKHLYGGFVNCFHLDLTYGSGGISSLINKKYPNDLIIAFDSPININLVKQKKPEKIKLILDNFINLNYYLSTKYNSKCSTIMIDLGYSNQQLLNPKLGLSYRNDGELNMNYLGQSKLTAATILNYWSVNDLTTLLIKYGEERYALSIAKKIVKQREIKLLTRTSELVDIIKHSVPSKYRRLKHPARKTFQALRIFINSELENLKKVLPMCLRYLSVNGRLFVISFNSLEDRIVKQFMYSLTKRPEGHKYLQTSAENKIKYSLIQRQPFKYERELNDIPNSFLCAKLRILVKTEQD